MAKASVDFDHSSEVTHYHVHCILHKTFNVTNDDARLDWIPRLARKSTKFDLIYLKKNTMNSSQWPRAGEERESPPRQVAADVEPRPQNVVFRVEQRRVPAPEKAEEGRLFLQKAATTSSRATEAIKGANAEIGSTRRSSRTASAQKRSMNRSGSRAKVTKKTSFPENNRRKTEIGEKTFSKS